MEQLNEALQQFPTWEENRLLRVMIIRRMRIMLRKMGLANMVMNIFHLGGKPVKTNL